MNLKLPRISIVTSDESGNGLQGEFSTLSLGLGLHRAWTYLTIFCSTSVFSSPVILTSTSSLQQINLFYLAAVVLSIAVLFIASSMSARMRSLLLAPRTIPCCAALCSIGTFILLAASLTGPISYAASLISALCCGISNAILILLWALSYARYEMMTIVINTAVSIFIAIVFFALLSYYLPMPFGAILAALLPLAEIPFLSRNVHARDKKYADLPKPNLLPTNRRKLGARIALPIFLFGYALGIVRYFSEAAINLQNDSIVFFLALIVAGVLMTLVLVVLFYFSESQADESLMRYLVPILVLAVIFLPIPSMAGSAIAAPLLLTAYLCFKAILWIFLCGLCQRFRLSPIFVVGIGFGSMALGSFLSVISLFMYETLSTITPFGGNVLIALAIIAMVIAYALLPRTADIAKVVPNEVTNTSDGRRANARKKDDEKSSPTTQDTHSSAIQRHSKEQNEEVGTPTQEPAKEPITTSKSARLQSASTASTASLSPHSQENHTVSSSTVLSSSSDAEKKPRESAADQTDTFREQCDILSNRYLLSRRENEVLYLLARGHNAAYIQDKLCVAQSTTKTHIYHIYQKLGIHTQQELITMVIEAMEE